MLSRSVVAFCFALATTSSAQQQGDALDNRDTCAHRVLNCDPDVDHFETKVEMDHSSTVDTLEYKNTYILLDQTWPTRGPWMKSTSQKIVFVRCGCPVPELSADWSEANVIHIPVSTVMVQMPDTLSKIYLMGQRSKVVAVESNRYISDATPEIHTDIRDGTVNRLDLSLNGKPSTRVTLSFTDGVFDANDVGFRLQLVDDNDGIPKTLAETECIFPASDDPEPLEAVMERAFNSSPGYVEAGKAWVIMKGDATATPSSLSYDIFFANQLPMKLTLQGEASTCGGDVKFNIDRSSAPANRPIYYRLHELQGGFPDVLIVQPRSLGPLADDPKVKARLFIDSDPGEKTPLGRAELMKLMAILLGSVETGNTLFDSIEQRYGEAKALAEKASYRPSVHVGKPGTWNEAARNSWMVTVGSTYVGHFLRDANVEYRNIDDSVNKELCGTGCGACPSGTSDTRCSAPLADYVRLFKSADFWISGGIGANCWSASCNFEIDADTLLDQNRAAFSQFKSMQCGSVIAIDKAHNGSGNSYWEMSRMRPDVILMDLVQLLHPDLGIQRETVFFRLLDPPSNTEGLPSCPVSSLPVSPDDGSVHVTSRYVVKTDNMALDSTVGAPHFIVLDQLPAASAKIASALGISEEDFDIAMVNNEQSDSSFNVDVTVRVPKCQSHSCGVDVGQKLNSIGSEEIERALALNGVMVNQGSDPTLVLDAAGDIIPLADLISSDSVDQSEPEPKPAVPNEPAAVDKSNEVLAADDKNDGLSTGAVVGIVLGVIAAFVLGMFWTYKHAYAAGKSAASQASYGQKEVTGSDSVA